MELINATRMVAGYNMGLEPSGRELLVVVIKGTFVLPKRGEQMRLADEQLPLVTADTFSGEPGQSAPIHEIDFAPRKRACEVLVVGSAHAPPGKQVTRLRVGIRVGPAAKEFDVVGDRVWQCFATSIRASAPQSFVSMPVSYDVAFGGVDRHSPDERQHDAYLANPVGRGWHKHLKTAWVDGAPLPNTEEIGKAVSSPTEKLRPMAFGPLARGWPQRARYAGTFDEQWLEDVFPFLPKDFDERYYQAAPEDQQLPLPKAPMEVVLTGLTADGIRAFVLPHFEAPVRVFPKRGDREDHTAVLDTISFEPDRERFTMSWRVARPLRRSLHEVAQVQIGAKAKSGWHQREHVAAPSAAAIAPMRSKESAAT